MKKILLRLVLWGTLYSLPVLLRAQSVTKVDVCVYGGTSAGIIAAYTAKQLHKSVLLIEPGAHLGGLTTGGLGYTDIGNKYAITGLALDFYRRIGNHYGKFEQWIFEPHVASEVFQQYLRHGKVTVWKRHQLKQVHKKGTVISDIELATANGTRHVSAAVFIDCSYEGDLMASAGVSYTVGREANSVYNETYNGVQLREHHQFPDGIDPYVVPGEPNSGLLWGITKDTLQPRGSGDSRVQAYNFRICLTSNSANRIAITRPADYDSNRYQLLLRLLEKYPAKDLRAFLKLDLMPNHKTDINNNGAFSTDMIGINYAYPEALDKERQQLVQAHENYTKGLLYFIGHDSRMPAHLRAQMLKWGYPKDEYVNNHHWSPQLYIREARRMKGVYVMTQANCEGREVVTDGVGMAAYTMDSHNAQRLVVNGMVKNEGNVEIGGFGPYPVSYRSIIPQAAECSNLLVPVCLSASHIAYGSIRMEPVFMALSQAAATAAVLAVQQHTTVQEVNVSRLQSLLKTNPLADGSSPELLIDNEDAAHITLHGEWKRVTEGAYGPSLLVHAGNSSGSVQFSGSVSKTGKYHIYTFLPKLEQVAPTVNVQLRYGGQVKNTSISPASIQIQGQTSGEWVSLDVCYLQAGKPFSATIYGNTSQGTTAADAILLVPERQLTEK
ncbi:FAD dependent oxidoreductase [Filimonas lacunae]|uniref:FAD dependent oxidoreductase n=1 Tax=Filimonas lacunae TaxID=477680 RepID=A0A173MP50_9BACT|nr:FAD-dependent oxidoreductase [Filimonas lacunae]BAV09412.1 xanthan lyase [Filimonas lacunae]SIS72666.1 FAD dependent oxidoreductase [Filimonas lacunae]